MADNDLRWIPYPTKADVEFAEKADAFYDSPYFKGGGYRHVSLEDAPRTDQEFFRLARQGKLPERRTDDRAVDVDMKAAGLAARRSAVASLGMDPERIVTTKGWGYQNVDGMYGPRSDTIQVRVGRRSPDESTAPVHESIHRGIQKMIDDKELPPEIRRMFRYNPDLFDELVTRRFMERYMGDPELPQRPKPYTDQLQYFGDHLDPIIDRMEAFAAERIRKNRPYGGPR